MPAREWPSFEDLPVDRNGPAGNAWGLWGPDDQLGTLNHLTDSVIARAAKEEIRTGERVSLNWSMVGPTKPRFPRKILEIKTTNKAPLKHAHDDEWTFNSQSSSQWDGFRHYAYQKGGLYFMGRTAEEFAKSVVPNGIQHVSARGIAGRAVLVDWYSWAKREGVAVHAFSDQAILFSDLLQVLAAQGMSLDSIREGDILFIRTGYIHEYENMDPARRDELDSLYQSQKPSNIGLEASREFLKLLWDRKVAAVAGDSRSFEAWPCKNLDWHMHEWLLAGWGMPIGELFDLEKLSEICKREGRYTFFLSSSPMNAPGAVASPPNALAFF